jgi:UDP-glucose 4-epimerase
MRILVAGGAGYIGSVVSAALLDAGHEVVVLDDCSTGHADAVPAGARFVEASLVGSGPVLAELRPDAVMHFAARSLVGESQERPELYWEQNVGGSLALLEAMRAAGCRRIVFSSTAAVYGEPADVPILEAAPPLPTNAYGATKLAVDHMLRSFAVAHGVAAVSLRYFNVAGAAYGLGERHTTETHLIPIALQVAAGERAELTVHGDDYPTPDGTCIRDYIHVADLADAHLLALPAPAEGEHRVYNLGNGQGFSVLEVIEAVREVTGHPIPVTVGPRRAGDPARLVASSSKARTELGWHPRHPALAEMAASAWTFLQMQQGGS